MNDRDFSQQDEKESAKEKIEDDQMKKKRRDHPEQMIDGDPRATGEYAAAHKEDFRMCIQEIFLEISNEVYKGDEKIAEKLTDSALVCFSKYFQGMKGGVNLTEEDVKLALREEEKRQRMLYSFLTEISEEFQSQGIEFEICETGYYFTETLWNTGPVPGCLLRVENNIPLYAYPLIPAFSNDYLVPRGGPIAAQVIFLNESCILFMQHGEDPSEKFLAAAESILGKPDDITDQIPHVHSALLYRDHLALGVLESYSDKELEEFRKRYGVTAVLHGDPHEFKASLYTGEEDDLPRVVKELLY